MAGNGTRPGVHGTKRARREQAFIAALLAKPTIDGAAAEAGISRRTAMRWLADETFKRAFRAARREALEATVARLQAITTDAADALHDSLKSDVAPSVRVSAARAIFEFSLRAAETFDLEDRIAALEARFTNEGGGAR